MFKDRGATAKELQASAAAQIATSMVHYYTH